MTVTSSSGTVRNVAGKGRLRRTGAMAALLTTVALLAGACGSSEEPESKDSPGATAEAKGKSDLVSYAKCMRKNGLSDFPDPGTGGGLVMPDGIDPNSEEFKKADGACAQYKPAGGPGQGNPGEGWSSEDQIKFAECMRENGVPKFPDPDPNGKGSVIGQGAGVDPESPQFKKATKECSKFQPEGMQNNVPNKKPGAGGGS